MKLDIEYRMDETYSQLDEHGNYEVVASETVDSYCSPYLAMKAARYLADDCAQLGADCASYPELDIINGTDQLEIDVYPVVLIDGVEVEAEGYSRPILSLTVNRAALKHHSGMDALRDAYNRLNRRAGKAYTDLD